MTILGLLIIDIIIVIIYGIALIVMLITKASSDEIITATAIYCIAATIETASLIERMNTEITSKENSIKELQYEIKEIEDIKAQADNFVTNLKNILD